MKNSIIADALSLALYNDDSICHADMESLLKSHIDELNKGIVSAELSSNTHYDGVIYKKAIFAFQFELDNVFDILAEGRHRFLTLSHNYGNGLDRPSDKITFGLNSDNTAWFILKVDMSMKEAFSRNGYEVEVVE